MKANNSIWKEKIDLVIASKKCLDRACEAARKAGCMDTDGPLYDSIWRSFDSMLEAVDRDGWICWFIYDNNFGKNHLMAGPAEKLRKIRTVNDLIWLLEESQATSAPFTE